MKRNYFSFLAFLASVILALGCQKHDRAQQDVVGMAMFRQIECDVKPTYAYFETQHSESGAKRLFILDEVGVTFSVKPREYAKRYADIAKAIRNSPSGLSYFDVNEGRVKYRETIGFVSKDCWDSVSEFAERYGLVFEEET